MSENKYPNQQQPKDTAKAAPVITGKLFVLCELSEHDEAAALLAELPNESPYKSGRIVIEMPLARLDEGDGMCAIVQGPVRFKDDEKLGRKPYRGQLKLTPIVRAVDHWAPDPRRGSGRVNTAGILNAFGRTILPACIKRNDPKADEDAIRIAYA